MILHGDSWTEREIVILVENYPKKNKDELIKLLPSRCYDGIRSKARRLGLRKLTSI